MGKSSKGSAFEREICKRLSLWWTDDKDDDIFWRTSCSGARATVRRKKNKGTFGQEGDIQATNPIGQPLIDLFAIELKRGYTSSSLMDIIDRGAKSKPSAFELFIEQARKEAVNSKAPFWMLITKRNQKNAIVTFPIEVMLELSEIGKGKVNLPFSKTFYTNTNNQITGICSFPLKTFFDIIKKEDIIKLHSENVFK